MYDLQNIYFIAGRRLALALAWAIPAVAPASHLATLSFEDNTLGALSGQGAGTGWTGSWTAPGNVTRAEVVDTTGNPLVYAVPGGATINGGSRALEVQLSGAPANQLAGVRAPATPISQTFYVSYLVRYVGSGTWAGANNTFTLHLGTSASDTGGVNFGLRGGATDEFVVRLGTGAPVAGASTGGDLANNQIYYLVCRMNWNGSAFTSADMWLNPGIADEVEKPNGDATLGGFSVAFPISHLFFRQAVLDANDILQADEIQIGTTWADVVPQALPKLQILLPGETAAPGTVPGKTGYPFPQLVGVPFNLTVHAVDAYWNVLNTSTDKVAITSTDDTATLPANAALLNGTATFSVTLNQTGSFTFTATDVSDGGVMNGVSSSVVVASPVPADMVTTHPWEAPGATRNPLMGFRPYLNGWLNGSTPNPYTTVVHHYIRWNQIENHANDTVDKIRDFCDSQWANLPASNVKVVPRVYLDWDSNTGNEYWPADLASGDWTSQEFKDRVVRLIGRLGEVWDDDPRVAWVQTGIIGWWGEQENPVSVNADGWAQRMGDAYTDAFRNKKFVVRNMNHWPGHPVGVYWDSFGHPGQTNGSWNSIRNFNNQGRYLTQVIEGEVAYNWGENLFDPLYGGEPTITLGTGLYTDNMIDVIRELHASALGWISSYRTDGSFGTDPDVVRANAARMQAAFGYRFHITEFTSSARTEPGANLEVRFKVKNKGSAPFYENWPVAVVLIHEGTRQVAWRATLPDVDIRTWQPGHNYDYNTRTYQTSAQEHEVAAAVPVPASLPPGQYLVGLSILEPNSRTPGIFFAVPNFFKQSQSQPLIRIGIGANAASHELHGVAFDDLLADDARYYTMEQAGPVHTLTLQPSAMGTITATPGGATHIKGTGLRLTANPFPGYEFSSWGGALAGWSHNPAVIVMDADKTVSANYVALPNFHTLTACAANGSVTLDPPSGFYGAGTVVTVTATPDSGYNFANWSGDLTGIVNPATITMDGDASVAANFAALSSLASFRVNCGGPAYTAGDGTLYEADGTYNSGGETYSTASAISGTTDDSLYQAERWANSFEYNIPMPNGEYEVTLMFSEINFTSQGRRVFDVAIEGNQVISNLDIWAKVGKDAAYDETHVVTVSDSQLNIAFSPVIENPKISAIRVEPMASQDFRLLPPVVEDAELRLEWTAGGILQTTTNLEGPWTDIPDAVSPYRIPITDPARFFRLKLTGRGSAESLQPSAGE